jgi:hypothetical protein
LQEGLGDECAEGAVGPGDENDLLAHVRYAPRMVLLI